MLKPRALIISGDGINCELETAQAFSAAGASSTIIHSNDWLERPRLINDFQLLALPGGFSFGDHLGAGQVMALKIKQGALAELQEFIAAGKGLIGICNGFQILLRLGLLPGSEGRNKPVCALTHNQEGVFIDKWVGLQVERTSHCWWTKDLLMDEFFLPIRCGEGRLIFSLAEHECGGEQLQQRGHVALRYTSQQTGSAARIAGLCNEQGNVFGLMPHPECALHQGHSPLRNKADDLGLAIFRKGVEAQR